MPCASIVEIRRFYDFDVSIVLNFVLRTRDVFVMNTVMHHIVRMTGSLSPRHPLMGLMYRVVPVELEPGRSSVLATRPRFPLFFARPEEHFSEELPPLICVRAHLTIGDEIAGAGKNLEQEQGVVNFLPFLKPGRQGFSLEGAHHLPNQ